MSARRWVALAALLGLAGCASKDGPVILYDNNDETLAVGNGALMSCSCLFVMGMSETYCRAWVRASPDVANYSIDYQAKRVTSTAFISWGAVAHYIDEKRGCVLE